MFHRFLTMFFERFSRYPKDRPLLYRCEDKSIGVVALVRAEDFDAEVRRMRLFFEREGYPSYITAVRPQVFPVFLFSSKEVAPSNFLTGNMYEAICMIQGCAVEARDFFIPPIQVPPNGREFIPTSYRSDIIHSEEIGREGSRVRSYTLDEAVAYLRRGKPLDAGLLLLANGHRGIKVRELYGWEMQ